MMTNFLQWTAWTMTPPHVYGLFHLIFFFGGTAVAVWLAWMLRTPMAGAQSEQMKAGRSEMPKQSGLERHGIARNAGQNDSSEKKFNRIMVVTGLILLAGEVYKQLMFYYVVNGRQYEWWLVPFQLCSLPMYLCLLLPFIHSFEKRRVICTFLLDFNMMGGIATFIDPSGIFHGYWTLTLHGVLWHLILIFIGMFILFSGRADLSRRGFLKILPLFAVSCGIAEMLNLLLHSKGSINLFYISPFEASTQIIFSDIDRIFGRPIGILLYMMAMVGGAWLVHSVCGYFWEKGKGTA